MNNDVIKKERRLGQKISWFFAMFCYVMSLISVVSAVYWKMENGTQDPIFASFLACIFFFGSCGFVLQYIANANLPDFNLSEKS